PPAASASGASPAVTAPTSGPTSTPLGSIPVYTCIAGSAATVLPWPFCLWQSSCSHSYYNYGNRPSYRSSASNCQATWRRRSSAIVSPASNRSQASTKDQVTAICGNERATL
ncbi:hypothetical protein GBAR_LOCUS6970, partial [Geodia barretti]